jgi:glucodextranase-like protein
VATKKHSEFDIAWMTVTYRSVILTVLAIAVAFTAATFLLFPDLGVVKSAKAAFNGTMEKMFPSQGITDVKGGQQQAHFTNIDGSVRVRKANSNVFVQANYDLPLDKGDVIKTDSQGIAKIAFTDGSSYTVKEDSLIVVEENSTNSAQQTQVAVNVTTGTVDLTTGTLSQGSKQEVRMAGSRTEVKSDTSLQASNDPRRQTQQVVVKTGAADFVTQQGEKVQLAPYERLAVNSDTGQIVKSRELAPPVLITPANLAPFFYSTTNKIVEFSWTPIDNAHYYHVRVSKNPYFTSNVYDNKRLQGELVRVSGLPEGAYYWVVQSVDEHGKESVESEKNKFTIVPRGTDVNLALDLNPMVQHGHVIEISGKTDPTARVMVNSQEVPIIGNDGTFHFFTSPLPNGENLITITAQNAKGGVSTQTKKVVIQ